VHTPASSVAGSGRSPGRGTATRTAFAARAVALTLAAIGLWQYLAGYLLLWSLHGSPLSATPRTLMQYAYYDGHHPGIRKRVIACSSLALLFVGGCAGMALRPRPRPLHGEARFARRAEVARAGLFGETGIILGEYGRRYLMLAGQQGFSLAAPPRSGKGVGIVIPNLLNWPDSVIVTDIKKENWTITAGFRRAAGQEVHLFDPLARDARTARWNPLSYVPSDLEGRIDGVQKIADMLYPETPGLDPFWIASARSLFVGISLYLFETPIRPTTIGEVRRQGMAGDDEGFAAHWKRLVAGRQRGRFPLSPECVRALYDVIDLAPVTASSIRKTFTSRLDLWANPILDRATSGDDFDLRALRSRRMSIYVGVNPDDLHRLRPVLSLFFQQALGLQTQKLPEHDRTLRYQLLMLMDECTALGRIPILAEAISYLPGYNVRVGLILQTPAQLREVYGPHNAEVMLKSLGARVAFAPKDFSDAKELSDELGFTTVRTRSVSRPRFAGFGGGSASRSGNVTVSEQRRALLLPQEVKELGTRAALIFCEGVRPIRGRKIRYFQDRRFRVRLLPPPEQPVATRIPALPGSAGGGTAGPSHDALGVGASVIPETSHASCTTREGTLEDVARLDSLELTDFAAEFDGVHTPADRSPTDPELHAAVDQFVAAFSKV
jgi:type IV secretion system protein VirD4